MHPLAALCLVLLLALPGSRAAAPPPADWQPAALPETLQFDLVSRHTGSAYRILVGLPHAEAPADGYPVLWMLDGAASYPVLQFARPRADDAQQGSRREAPRPSRPAGLIVAVAYASGRPFDIDARALDYTPPPDADTGDRLSPAFGGSAAFRRFLVEELRPLIARHFPLDAKRHTLFGFSYGGLFAIDTLLTEPEHFQRYWAASPSMWFSEAQIMRRLDARAAIAGKGAVRRVTLTVGRDEQYPAAPLPAGRQVHLDRRAIVDRVGEAGERLAQANPGVRVETLIAADHDHFDMLMHGARRVVEFAFSP